MINNCEFDTNQSYSDFTNEDKQYASSASEFPCSTDPCYSSLVALAENIDPINSGSRANGDISVDNCVPVTLEFSLASLESRDSHLIKNSGIDGSSPWLTRKTSIQDAMMNHGATICFSIDFGNLGQRDNINFEKYIDSTGHVPFSSWRIPDYAFVKNWANSSAMHQREPHMTRLRAKQTTEINGRQHIEKNITLLDHLSEMQLRGVSHILTSNKGATAIEQYERFVFREHRCDDALSFTSMHNQYIFAVVPNEIWSIGQIASLPERFLYLLGLTIALWRSGTWIRIYEERRLVSRIACGLADAWSSLIGCSDAELGIDSCFTRSAVEILLVDLEDMLGNNCHRLKFNWRPSAYL